MAEPDDERPRHRLVYGRRQGHRLSAFQARLMETLLPALRVPLAARAALEPASLFPSRPERVCLEIGFGGGEHLLARAAAEPEAGFLGAEPFVNGVAKLLAGVERLGLRNIRIWDDDARDLLAALAPGSLDAIWILYPDPWPKARHKKRRFVRPETVAEFARVLKPGGTLLFASDIPDYVDWTLDLVLRAPELVWTARQADDWRKAPDGWPGTRYEAKARREGRAPAYLAFRRW